MAVLVSDCDCILLGLLINTGQSPIRDAIVKHCNRVGVWALRRTHQSLYTTIPPIKLRDGLCVAAAEYGYLNILKLARSHKYVWNYEVYSMAAKNGHIDILEWASKNGCAWDLLLWRNVAMFPLESIAWALKYECLSEMGRIMKYGHANETRRRRDIKEIICDTSAAKGRIDILEFARKRCFLEKKDICYFAALYGQLNVLQWAREHGCDWDWRTCAFAAENGHLDVLKWAREHGCEWDSNVCELAAQTGHLEVLQWAREHGCPE